MSGFSVFLTHPYTAKVEPEQKGFLIFYPYGGFNPMELKLEDEQRTEAIFIPFTQIQKCTIDVRKGLDFGRNQQHPVYICTLYYGTGSGPCQPIPLYMGGEQKDAVFMMNKIMNKK